MDKGEILMAVSGSIGGSPKLRDEVGQSLLALRIRLDGGDAPEPAEMTLLKACHG
jgi:hypothetical protein